MFFPYPHGWHLNRFLKITIEEKDLQNIGHWASNAQSAKTFVLMNSIYFSTQLPVFARRLKKIRFYIETTPDIAQKDFFSPDIS